MIDTLMSVGLLALFAAFIAVPLYYLSYRTAPEPKKALSLLRYVLSTLAAGAAGYVAGAAVGIAIACSSDGAGNLCGLAGVFGTGPLAAAIVMAIYARATTRRARQLH